MSVRKLEESIERLKGEMSEFSPYQKVKRGMEFDITPKTEVDKSVVLAVSELLENYGTLIGRAKAKFPTHFDRLEKIDKEVSDQFSYLYGVEKRNWRNYFSIVNMGVQKVSEVIAYVEELESVVSEGAVPKSEYDQAIKEIENQKRVIDILAKSRGLPLLNELIQKSKACGMDIDEDWAVTICAVNLIEAAVNKKLEDLSESTEGEFNKKLDRLTKIIKEKQNRNIQKLIPRALKTVRDKLDHASHDYKPTSIETTTFVEQALSFLDNLFPSEDEQ